MTSKPGFYLSSHDGCTIFEAHRHPMWAHTVTADTLGQRTPQPKRVLVEVPATVT
jgi:hypothetical protein